MKRAASVPTSSITSAKVTNSPLRFDMGIGMPPRRTVTICTKTTCRASEA